jgi:hypothetical protein
MPLLKKRNKVVRPPMNKEVEAYTERVAHMVFDSCRNVQMFAKLTCPMCGNGCTNRIMRTIGSKIWSVPDLVPMNMDRWKTPQAENIRHFIVICPSCIPTHSYTYLNPDAEMKMFMRHLSDSKLIVKPDLYDKIFVILNVPKEVAMPVRDFVHMYATT